MSKKKVFYGAIIGAISLSALVVALASTGSMAKKGEVAQATGSLGSSEVLSGAAETIDQTIYVFSTATGEVKKTVSSNWMRDSLDTDIYSKNETKDTKLPVSLNVKYFLDGEEISPEELKGKSGKIRVLYEFENEDREEGYFVPYAVVTGLVLDSEKFSNVVVRNGKLLNDGGRLVVVGMTLPGLQEDLKVAREKLEIPEYFEFEAEAKNFELGISMSIVTNEVFQELNLEGLDSVEDLSRELSKLTNAIAQLIDGSAKLYEGLSELYEKTSTLPEGISRLNAGLSELQTGMEMLKIGSEAVSAGIQGLSEGLSALEENNATLQAGAEATFLKLLEAATAQINLSLAQYGMEIPALTIENYQTILSDEIFDGNAEVMGLLSSLNQYNAFYQGLKMYFSGVSNAVNGAKELSAGAEQVAGGAGKVLEGLNTAKTGAEALNLSAPALVQGISELRDGSKALSEGINMFNEEGVKKLVEVYDNDIKGLVERIKAISELSKKQNKNVKYIYRTEEI